MSRPIPNLNSLPAPDSTLGDRFTDELPQSYENDNPQEIFSNPKSEVESYSSYKYRAFSSQMHEVQRMMSFQVALNFVSENIHSIPMEEVWKVFVELADVAKKENLSASVIRRLLIKSTRLQPYATSTWLELCKLEEECGNFVRSRVHSL